MPDVYTVELPVVFNGYNSETFSQSISPLWVLADVSLVIDMRPLKFITPAGMTMLASFLLFAAKTNLASSIQVIRPADPSVDHYLERMDFFSQIHIANLIKMGRFDSTGRFMEVRTVDTIDNASEIVSRIISVFVKQKTISDLASRGLRYGLSEVIDNTFHHSESAVHPLVAAQYFPTTGLFEISVADCGIGFKNSLQKNPNYKKRIRDDLHAIETALEKGVTSTPNRNTGEGLFFLKEILQDNGGDLIIHSGEGHFHFKANSIVAPWRGSVVNMRFNLRKSINMTDIFNKYNPLV